MNRANVVVTFAYDRPVLIFDTGSSWGPQGSCRPYSARQRRSGP
jgi:hypothetical protein